MEKVRAVKPYIHQGNLNFKVAPYDAWICNGGETKRSFYPCRFLHGFAYRWNLPYVSLLRGNNPLLMFVEPLSITFDTFPYYATHEIIPFVWDCWPQFFEKMAHWMERYKIRTAIFTCKETAILMKKRFPQMNIMYCPEGVDSKRYSFDKNLAEREIDLLEFGRPLFKYVPTNERLFNETCSKIKHVRTGALSKRPNDEELYNMMANSKVTICYPHCFTEPDWCDGLETLTQRYWECMLSGMVIIGHAPKELVDLIEYNPCVEVKFNGNSIAEKITKVLENIRLYQPLIEKNYLTAKRMSDWSLRIKDVSKWLESLGYSV